MKLNLTKENLPNFIRNILFIVVVVGAMIYFSPFRSSFGKITGEVEPFIFIIIFLFIMALQANKKKGINKKVPARGNINIIELITSQINQSNLKNSNQKDQNNKKNNQTSL